ncbi:hypothetical protein GEOBRER4_n3724 [Citrifermentans bremense]|uniref:Uncharacterized protein n=1 Tax=Citrifermentans bremense TaxID=60035 RepID=A0A6S6M505_9BACT|nr:hypothetical protein [Citrifermentans bremense]BCG48828.1 hypothetical protein GEOBRER4_n3724 [Citrifermentans bremense]
MKPSCCGGSLEQQYFTAEQLSAMIDHHLSYWVDPSGKSDIEAETANVLNRNCVQIAKQLLLLLKLGSTPLVAETGRE